MATNALVARFLNHWKKWAGGMCILILVMAFVLSDDLAKLAGYGAELPTDKSEMSPGARFFRDFVVFVVAAIGIVLAIRRAIDLNRQAKTAESQFKQAESRMFNERFTTAAELMAKEVAGNPAIAARVSGIHIMGELASAKFEGFLPQTIKTMVAYIKDNAQITATPRLEERLPDAPRILGEDVKAAFAVMGDLLVKRDKGLIPGSLFPDVLDFSNVNFSHLDLSKGQVGEVRWFKKWNKTDLSGASLQQADLQGADFTDAILHGASLAEAKLGGACLKSAQLQGADLKGAHLHAPAVNWIDANLYWARLWEAHIDVTSWHGWFFATDFSGARIKNAPDESSKKRITFHVWHSRGAEIPEFADIVEQGEKDPWRLDKCPSTSAFVGVLRNFAEYEAGFFASERAKELRKVLLEARVTGEIPPNLPNVWLEWLKHISKPPHKDGHLSLSPLKKDSSA